ncbi:hypothetical protein EHI8A_192980 [Entamoeba histolytica HM-1:IMSS-B]|uniref:Ras family protein n=4 Tax=Entamoeba histolytica TaxID=5759 RepID=C4LSQ9_ENTH1|nr:hypothetical protein EHI_152210 [Entamoeba histolytica HM-1:IMSS]EAL51507.2 hypothetical protein EHI_152210 [Entamoeba histolytica HM-1:IMSS]EMD43052.1 Hypothetical protein EHI5A_073820 [Entamoeba histolytica KU27]EMH73837.1 hypothetical protein EHI8A_192980 [Entamoeba histolytica HM-1:IMSS-B]GAT91471.1 hypothetical protein CL6EHI_152210 [Entamoeba histolytica]|eukprot:XP_656893.2 hypothetical protein EHI_152210 [Entamoeba histolytica HM-1:IMSS]
MNVLKKDKKENDKKKDDKKKDKKKSKTFRLIQERDMTPGIQVLKTPLSEKDVLYTIKIVFVGDPCTLDDRKKLLWGYYHNHQSQVVKELGTTMKDVRIDGFDGRISMTLYDNNINRATSYFPFSGAHGIFLVYRNDDDMSFRHVYNWLSEARRFCNKENVFAYVIGIFPNEESINQMSQERKAILHLMKMKTFNYCPGKEKLFDEFINEMVCSIRKINFRDDILEVQWEKRLFESGQYKKPKKGFIPIQSELESSQRKQMEKDPYRRLINQEIDRGLTYTIRLIFCGDEIIQTQARRLAVGLLNGFDQPIKSIDNLDNLATTYREIDNKFLKVRAVGYDLNYKRGLQYSPFVNALGSVIFFDYTNEDSFKHLPIWVKESYKGNLSEMLLFICGLNKTSNKRKISETEVIKYLDSFPPQRKPVHCDFEEKDIKEFVQTFKNYVNTIRRKVFKKGYLTMVEREMVAKERLGTIESSEMMESSKLTPKNFKEDEKDEGCNIQ